MPKKNDAFTAKQITKLAKRIKSIRISQGYTSYEHFANEKGMSRMQYWRYEKGEDLRFSSLVKLAVAFEIRLAEFFDEGFD